MFFDVWYLIFLAPGLILAGYATWKTKGTFAKYSRMIASSRLSGAQAARHILDTQGLRDVKVERVSGFLSDHYDPRGRVLRLSPPVYDSPSLSAIGVACHEAGHALQHAANYAPLSLRSAMVPAVSFSSKLWQIVLIAGLLLHLPGLLKLAIILLAATVLFSLVTLPVEWDASARAKRLMVGTGIVTQAEQEDTCRVLNAAFLTYLASAVTAILTLLYFLMRFRR